jgi:hypothetical protein
MATACTNGCTADTDCAQGQRCATGAHPRCVPLDCISAPCPLGFECGNVTCFRKQCTTDSDCGAAGALFCVEGLCYDSLGQCMTPPP